jgi:hypothetical protein
LKMTRPALIRAGRVSYLHRSICYRPVEGSTTCDLLHALPSVLSMTGGEDDQGLQLVGIFVGTSVFPC